MSIYVSDEVSQYWKWSNSELESFANANFSDDMLASVGRQNQLRLSNRSGNFQQQGRVTAIHYLPFGLIPTRMTRNSVDLAHYATNKSVSKASFGTGRFDFFFHQLMSSDWVENAEASQQFGVGMTLQLANTVPANWGTLIRTDFGTSPAGLDERELAPVSFDTPPSFPYNMFLRPNETDGVLFASTPLIQRTGGSLLDFVTRLKVAARRALPQNRDSGRGEDYRIVNLFLTVVSPQVGGGGADGLLTLTAKPSDGEWLVNPKALLTPATWQHPTCFWECLMAALCIRQETSPESFTDAVDLWMKDMCVQAGLTTRQREGQMKRIQWNVLAFVQWCQEHGIDAHETKAVSVDETLRLGKMFGFESVTVISESGEVMVGSGDDLHLHRAESNHLLLMWRNSHFSLVMSYTALIPVKECSVCGERFSSEKTQIITTPNHIAMIVIGLRMRRFF